MSKLERDPSAAALDLVDARITDLDRRFNERMERIGQRLEEVADFLGTAAEMQIATQHKVDALGVKIDRMVELEHERDLKWDARLTQLNTSLDRMAGSIERMAEAMDRNNDRNQATIDRLMQMVIAFTNSK